MKTTIGIFFGGRSVEHEISVISALQAIGALDDAKYETVPVYITKQGKWLTGSVLLDSANYRDMASLERRATEIYMRPEWGAREVFKKKSCCGKKVAARLDVALPVFHGTGGEDGSFQGFLELTGIPYVGPGVLSSALGMDKIAMKMVLRECGLPVIDWVWFTDRQWHTDREKLMQQIESQVGYPAIVKPANLGSSVGISRARNREELARAIATAEGYSSRILVEKMIEPLREINCSVCGSYDDYKTSVCEEPVRSGEILSYADKYLSGGGKNGSQGGAKTSAGAGMASVKRRLPADLSDDMTAEIRRLAGETFRCLGCEGVARIDFILDGNAVYINEINTIPGSLSFYLWEATGLKFTELMDTLVAGALRRDRDRGHKIVSYSDNIFNMGSFGGKGGKK